MSDTRKAIREVCASIERILLAKNDAYGDSAVNPLKIFIGKVWMACYEFGENCKTNLPENARSILARLDDKLARVKNSDVLRKNDIADIMGYLILLCVAVGWETFDDLLE